MCYYILTGTCEIISRTTVQHVTDAESNKDTVREDMESYMTGMADRISNEKFKITSTEENTFYLEDTEGDENERSEMEDDPGIPEADEYTSKAFDTYLGAQLLIPTDEGRIQGRVTKRVKDNGDTT